MTKLTQLFSTSILYKIFSCSLMGCAFLISLNSLSVSAAYAQADRGGLGGDWSEAELKHFLSRLSSYLQSEEGKRVFPEVEVYHSAHPDESIEKLASELNPRLVEHAVYDSEHNERDCVSFVEPIRYFECNQQNLPHKPSEKASDNEKSEYYGSMYRLVLHEVFVQAGLERPLAKEVPSSYAISSRLMVHLEKFPEWVPGGSKSAPNANEDLALHTKAQWSLGLLERWVYNDRHLGLDAKLQFPMNLNGSYFKFGLDAVFSFAIQHDQADWDGGIDSKTPWWGQVLITAEYDLPTHFFLHPYIGLGIGVRVEHDTNQVSSSAAEYYVGMFSDSQTNFNMAIQFTPGVNLGDAQKFFVEMPILISSHLFYGPEIGMHF